MLLACGERNRGLHAITALTYNQPKKVNRDKLSWITCRWKCKNGKRLTITAYSFMKID